MAKSSRSSSKKANNQRLAAKVFGPAETARAERLSARLLELARQPKPKPESADVNMDSAQNEESKQDDAAKTQDDETTMEVDSVKPSQSRIQKKRIDKRRVKKSSIVFRKYGERQGSKRKKTTS